MAASNAGGVGKDCDSQWISGYLIDDCWYDQQLRRLTLQFTGQTATHQWMTCLSQQAWTTTMKRREENLILCSGKSEAEVTNNRRLRSTYCAIEDNYWRTRSITRPLCDCRATRQ